jgi:hypothetical protein
MGKGEVDEKKGDKKDGLRKKGHVAAAAGELGEELSARAGELGNWSVRSENRSENGYSDWERGCQGQGEKAASWRRDKLRPTLGGLSLSKWILVSSPKRDSFAGISRIRLVLSL